MDDGGMPAGRNLDIAGVERGRAVVLHVNGWPVNAYEGESVAAALMRLGKLSMRASAKCGEPRSYYCGMGVCYDCLVDVVGIGPRRSCQLAVSEGLNVRVPESDR
jgi:D-hydroxyproline dehydrogenase subunit gamma